MKVLKAEWGNDGWIRCGECRHKLARAVGGIRESKGVLGIEIKCHVCKNLNHIIVEDEKHEE